MKYLVIADIHHKIDYAQKIIDWATANKLFDKIVLLGDLFDNFDDVPDEAAKTAKWAAGMLAREDVIYLFGNHDIYYAYSHNLNLRCSGNTESKKKAILKNLDIHLFRDKARFFYSDGDFIFSHAGFSSSLLRSYLEKGIKEKDLFRSPSISEDIQSKAKKTIDLCQIEPLVFVSEMRGGRNSFGGVTWCDFREFSPIPNYFQIFGHTKIHSLNYGSKNLAYYMFKWYFKWYHEYEYRKILLAETNLSDITMSSVLEDGCGLNIDSDLNSFAIADSAKRDVSVYAFPDKKEDPFLKFSILGV